VTTALVIDKTNCRDRERAKTYCRHRQYKMTCAEFEDLWQRSQGHCEMCGRREWPSSPNYIDHDPDLDKSAVRGMLCVDCNARFDDVAFAGPKRDEYLRNAWYLTVPGRPMPQPVENRTRTRREANRIAAELVRRYIAENDLRPMLREELASITLLHDRYGSPRVGRPASR